MTYTTQNLLNKKYKTIHDVGNESFSVLLVTFNLIIRSILQSNVFITF